MSDVIGPTDDEVEAGHLLARERELRGLSVDEVTRALLLSKAQVEGLEQARPSAFYSHQFYRQALRKYAAYLQVTLPELPAPPPVPAPVLAAPPPTESFEAPASRRPVVLAVAVVLVAAVVTGGWFLLRSRAAGATAASEVNAAPVTPPAPAVPAVSAAQALAVDVPGPSLEVPPDVAAEASVVPPPSTAAAPPSSAPGAGAASAIGIVTVDDPTWIFVRYADGTVVQRAVNPGEQLALTQRMVYLAAGTPTVHLTVADRMIDMRAFVTPKGEVRVSARQMDGWPFPDVPAGVPSTASTP